MTTNAVTPDAVADWWLGAARTDLGRLGERMPVWFGSDAAMDAELRSRFGTAIEQASNGSLDAWAGRPNGRLALILLLDQFRRNVFRGTAAAFALDPVALRLCQEGLDAGIDEALELTERLFFCMPLQHAESESVQHRAVSVFDALAAEAPPEGREVFRGCADYARQHRDIVLRFGRFPHRNAVLGRASTPEERAFLKDGPSFGQG